MLYKAKLPVILITLFTLISIACSAGTLLVRAPKPTPTPTKTPRPLFTATLIPSPTPLPTDTPSPTPIPSDTPTPVPTEAPTEAAPTEAPPTDTPVPAATHTPAPPPPPTNTPEPTPTPEPSFPYPAELITHPTGGEVEFRITGLVWAGNLNTGQGAAQQGFQMEVITPGGATETSEVSVGPDAGSSTVMGAGDNHSMNFQYKHAPYQPGVYKVTLVKDGQPMAPTVEVVAEAGPPYTYAHINFLRQQ